ncbi:hypothetical protein M569_16957, partial [Genlisea aurea]
LLLGIGFLVQGLRCFPWMAVNFFLKDGLKVDPSTLQILQNSANLPMVAKPLYGILSDSFYIFGQHRVPYIALGALLQAASWISIASFSGSGISFLWITFYLLLGNLGASIVEVANDAMVAETATNKQPAPSKTSSSGGGLQSFVWIAASAGGVVGNLIGGFFINHFSPQLMFAIYGVLLCVQFSVTSFIRESSLSLPETRKPAKFNSQMADLLAALKTPEILYSIVWFALSYAVIPALTGTMFYYQTQHLKIDSWLLGISKVTGQAAMLLWGVVYNRRLKGIPSRRLISAVQVSMAALMASDYLFVKGVYRRRMGIPDSAYVVVVSGLLEVVCFFKMLPFGVLMARLCPPGFEGSVMAVITSALALALIVSGYLGVALGSYVVGEDYGGFGRGLLIQCGCTLLPVFWANRMIPDDEQVSQLKSGKK